MGLSTCNAEFTSATSGPKPSVADDVSNLDVMLPRAKFHYFPDTFMSRYKRWCRFYRPVALKRVEIRMANSRGKHFNQCLIGARLWKVKIVDGDFLVKFFYNSSIKSLGFSRRDRAAPILL